MRIGLVSPYSFDVPGGVQLHVRDLAEHLLSRGHHVSVLAPADEGTRMPPYAVSAGAAVPVRFNGSVARLAFGPVVSARVKRWTEEGNFDVVHVHEPASPSVSMMAVWAAQCPVVATFHTSMSRSRRLRVAEPILRSTMEKISARIAVSEAARRTMAGYLGGDTLVIPNGVYVDRFRRADEHRWGPRPDGLRVVFLGRFGESRKGLPVLAGAAADILREHPDTVFLVAGPGDVAEAARDLPVGVASAFRFLGPVSDAEKVDLLGSADVYVAPNTGGESFGIILIEAMAAGAPVVASDLAAFTAVLDGGRCGLSFPNGDASALAERVNRVLGDPELRRQLSATGSRRAATFDWSRVGEQVLAVYESVLGDGYPRLRDRSPVRRLATWIRR